MMINNLIIYLDKNRKLFNLPGNEKISIELHSPWRNSHNGTCQYIVYIGNKRTKQMVIKDNFSLYGIKCRCNPYKPQFHKVVGIFLPENLGVFSLNDTEFYWADWIQGKSLFSIISENPSDPDTWKILSDFVDKFSSMQIETVSASSDYYNELKELMNQKITRKENSIFFGKFGENFDISLYQDPIKIPCSWSHGDLWSRDIFLSDKSWRIIDWEYCLNVAPLGSDIIDLYVTIAEQNLKISTPDAWRGFLFDEIPLLSQVRGKIFSFWAIAGFNDEQKKSVYLYALIRSIGRIISQDGTINKSDLESYSQIVSEITHDMKDIPLAVIQHKLRVIRNRCKLGWMLLVVNLHSR